MATPQNSIFGVQAPKFQYSSDAVVELDYAIITKDNIEEVTIKRSSIITKKNSFVDFDGAHYQFEVLIHLFKYKASALSKFTTIWAYKYKEVKLWRRRDKGFFADSTGNAVLFKLTEIVPSFMNSPDFSDLLLLKFESSDLIDLSKLEANLGTELITDGGFPSGTNFSLTGQFTISGGVLNAVCDGTYSACAQTVNAVASGNTYRVSFDAVLTSGSIGIYYPDDSEGSLLANVVNGYNCFDFVAGSSSGTFHIKRNGGACNATIDNFSVKKNF